jgi:hypothetical protein
VEVFSFVSENRKVKTPALSHKTRQGRGTRRTPKIKISTTCRIRVGPFDYLVKAGRPAWPEMEEAMTRNQIHSIFLGAFVLVSALIAAVCLPAAAQDPDNYIERWRRWNNI